MLKNIPVGTRVSLIVWDESDNKVFGTVVLHSTGKKYILCDDGVPYFPCNRDKMEVLNQEMNNMSMSKELLVCPRCGNSKNEVYAEIKDFQYQKIFVRCPNCGKESLVAYMQGNADTENE